MKHRDVIKRIKGGGGYLERHGSEHDIYRGPNGNLESVPRHKEIKEMTANRIFKRLGV
jgi:mRNA interferase HicA